MNTFQDNEFDSLPINSNVEFDFESDKKDNKSSVKLSTYQQEIIDKFNNDWYMYNKVVYENSRKMDYLRYLSIFYRTLIFFYIYKSSLRLQKTIEE